MRKLNSKEPLNLNPNNEFYSERIRWKPLAVALSSFAMLGLLWYSTSCEYNRIKNRPEAQQTYRQQINSDLSEELK